MDEFSSKHIAVIGDAMLDIYTYGSVTRVSPEAPVVIFNYKSQRMMLGGAANVAKNLSAAGQSVSLISVLGTDDNGSWIFKELNKINVDASCIIRIDKKTTVKTRLISEENQQVIRIDNEDVTEISDIIVQQILELLEVKISIYDLIVISDYQKGLVTEHLFRGIEKIAKQYHVRILTDGKDENAFKYHGSFLIKPNIVELHRFTHMPTDTYDAIEKAAKALLEICSSKYVLVTCGERGMLLVSQNCSIIVESVVKELYDVTGAGDTVLAYLSACIANNIAIIDSIKIANIAAGLQVEKPGTSSIAVQEVLRRFNVSGKMLKISELSFIRESFVQKIIVFTNGCFDIIHSGHIHCLRSASQMGDILVVGINSDESVKRLKGSSRPILNVVDRAEIICSLEFVDYVVIFDDDSPYNVIRSLKPDILVKGSDYTKDDIVGKDIVEACGGRVETVNLVKNQSTTSIIEKIIKANNDRKLL